MSVRLVIGILLLALASFFNVVLLFREQIVAPDAAKQVEQKAVDPLQTMKFTKPNREANLVAFGFPPGELAKVNKRIGELEKRYFLNDETRNRVRYLLTNAVDKDSLQADLCESSRLPTRYAAMRYLVEDKGASLQPLDLITVTDLTQQDWFNGGAADGVYARLEKVDRLEERKPDATIMGWAAILSRKEEKVLNVEPPWGTGALFNAWSWGDVKKENVGVEDAVIGYAALLHLVVEEATRSEGLCQK